MMSVSLEQAVEMLLKYCKPIQETEMVPVWESCGRILAEDMVAPFDNPPFDRSPVDGYACRAEDLLTASAETPVTLEVLCEIDAGDYKEIEVRSGEAVRIMTGAAIPKGCDCCIYQEKTDYGEEQVKVYTSAKKWDNYCFKGDDYKAGAVLIKKETRLTYIEAAILSSMGKTKVCVYRLPKVSLLTTGDEVIAPGSALLPGKIYYSNLTLLATRLKDFGADLVYVKAVEDDPVIMASELKHAAKRSDLVITTGGVSVGKKDILHEAIQIAGAERIFWKVSLKPGMPTLFSVLKDVPVLSLSGNPFGVAVTCEVMIRPMLERLGSNPAVALSFTTGVMQDEFKKGSGCRRMIRAILQEGKLYLPDVTQSNGILSTMTGCNCLIDIPAGHGPLRTGETCNVILL